MIEKLESWLGWIATGIFSILVIMSFMNIEIHPVMWWISGLYFLAYFSYLVVIKNMIGFVIKRLFEGAIAVFLIATMTFGLLRILPGGPFDSEKALPPEIKANIEARYNLNASIPEQYIKYMTDLLKGDLGESYKYIGRGTSEIIAETLPKSIQLGVYALIVSYLIGIPLGLMAASRHGTKWDSASMIFAISGVSLPSFLVAPLFIIFFSFWLGWFEPALWDGPAYYVLPMVILGIRPAAVIARLTRSSVLEVIRSDFIRTARAKGLEESVILYKHVLRNSLIPVLTLSGPLIAGILTGSFVIEQIFAIPGMAKHLVSSVTNRDYPLILGCTLLFSVMLVVSNILTDLLIAAVDPRVKMGE